MFFCVISRVKTTFLLWNSVLHCSIFYLDESPFRHIFQNQITDLVLACKSDIITDFNVFQNRKYQHSVFKYTIEFFKNLQYLSMIGFCPILLLSDCPLTTCSSSILKKLCIDVCRFEDCLVLLGGRLKNLTTFMITISCETHISSVVYNMENSHVISFFSS